MLNLLAAFKIIDLCISVLNLAIKALKRLLAEPSSLVTQPLLISPDCRGFFHSSARWVGSSGPVSALSTRRCSRLGLQIHRPRLQPYPAPGQTPDQGQNLSLCSCPASKDSRNFINDWSVLQLRGSGNSPAWEILMSSVLLMRERRDLLPRAHADLWAHPTQGHSCCDIRTHSGQPRGFGEPCARIRPQVSGTWEGTEGTGLHKRPREAEHGRALCRHSHRACRRLAQGHTSSSSGVEHKRSPQAEVPVPRAAPAGHHLQQNSVPRQRRATRALQKHLFDPPSLLSG